MPHRRESCTRNSHRLQTFWPWNSCGVQDVLGIGHHPNLDVIHPGIMKITKPPYTIHRAWLTTRSTFGMMSMNVGTEEYPYTAKPVIMLSGSSIAIDSLELHKITYCEKTSELFGFVQAYRNFTENVLQVNLFSNGGHFQIMEPWT